MTFLRPKPGQPPTTATFEVPLTFNKFDFRDYLYHLYNVEVTSVRSLINQRMPVQRSSQGSVGGQWYRPRAQKLMIVDLVKPFQWPARPAAEDMTAWDHKLYAAVEENHAKDVEQAEARNSWGPQKMRTQQKLSDDLCELRKQAQALLAGKVKWTPALQQLIKIKQEDRVEEDEPNDVPVSAAEKGAEEKLISEVQLQDTKVTTEAAEESVKSAQMATPGVLPESKQDERRP